MKKSGLRRRRREVKELRADTYMVGLRVNHPENDGDCEGDLGRFRWRKA